MNSNDSNPEVVIINYKSTIATSVKSAKVGRER